MAARVEEAYSEREQKVDAKGNLTETEISYIVFEAADEDAALAYPPSAQREPRSGR